MQLSRPQSWSWDSARTNCKDLALIVVLKKRFWHFSTQTDTRLPRIMLDDILTDSATTALLARLPHRVNLKTVERHRKTVEEHDRSLTLFLQCHNSVYVCLRPTGNIEPSTATLLKDGAVLQSRWAGGKFRYVTFKVGPRMFSDRTNCWYSALRLLYKQLLYKQSQGAELALWANDK